MRFIKQERRSRTQNSNREQDSKKLLVGSINKKKATRLAFVSLRKFLVSLKNSEESWKDYRVTEK